MNTDLNELKELVAAIKEDHQQQKDNAKRDSWTKFVSLTLICVAVLAAIASQKGGGYSSATLQQLNEATFQQANASDEWAYYQAKSIKQNLYELERERLTNNVASPDLKALAEITARIKKYEADKAAITNAAVALEAARDAAKAKAASASAHGGKMGLAVTLFQISIALGGITLIVKKRWLWFASILTGLAAAVQMILVLRMPL